MPSFQTLDHAVIDVSVDRAVQAVFKIMIGKPACSVPVDFDPDNYDMNLGQIHVVGTVGVVGEINGLIYLYFTVPLAEHCATRLLGISAAKIKQAGDRLVNDVVGELTNMTFGTFKNQLAEIGFPCRLTLPSVLRGERFTINPVAGATRRFYRFDLAGETLMADIILATGQ